VQLAEVAVLGYIRGGEVKCGSDVLRRLNSPGQHAGQQYVDGVKFPRPGQPVPEGATLLNPAVGQAGTSSNPPYNLIDGSA
jgi:hypothetical protein